MSSISGKLAAPWASPPTPAEPSGEPYNPRFSILAVIAAFTAIFVLRFFTFFLDDVTKNIPNTFVMRIVEEGTGAYGAMLLFPVLFLLERRFPLSSGRWRVSWAPQVAGFAAYSAAHTSLMWVCRAAILHALGHGPYDYGRMSTRYFMEAPNDFFAYGAFLGVMTLLRVMHAVRERDLRVEALARTAAESRLAALHTRLQPHFLFNALNAIASAVYDDPAAADAMIGHLGELLRHALRTSTQPEIALADELGVLQSYLEIVHARFGERVSFDLEVAPDTEALAVPALLLQPLVENAVRHGSVMEYASTIKIRIARMRDDLHITVENEMPPTETTGRTPGTGLSTTRDRLRLMYGEAHSFEARGIGSRFIVNIRLPMRSVPLLTQMEPAQVHAGADR